MVNKTVRHLKNGTLLNVIVKKLIRRERRLAFLKYQRNLYNIFKYGPLAPRFGETIWINPCKYVTGIPREILRKECGFSHQEMLGMVIDIKLPTEQTFNIADYPKGSVDFNSLGKALKTCEYRSKLRFKFCLEHWVDGVPWEHTGAYEYMEKEIEYSKHGEMDGCKNIDDIVKRYVNLDLVFEQVRNEGRFRLKKEVDHSCFLDKYEWNRLVHINSNGEILTSGGSMHRFAIAYILNIPFPAKLGCVHVDSLQCLNDYRKV